MPENDTSATQITQPVQVTPWPYAWPWVTTVIYPGTSVIAPGLNMEVRQ